MSDQNALRVFRLIILIASTDAAYDEKKKLSNSLALDRIAGIENMSHDSGAIR